MGWLQDMLKEVPLSAVLKERVALAEDESKRDKQRIETLESEIKNLRERIAASERENENLRAKVPKSAGALSEDTKGVLVHLFKTVSQEDRDVGAMSRHMVMEEGVLQYHLDQLGEAGFADMTGMNYIYGGVYWGISPAGRRYVVENELNNAW
jgi:hypothetical protein